MDHTAFPDDARCSGIAVTEGIVVIATIHCEPSLDTLTQFTRLLLLAESHICFFGHLNEVESFMEGLGRRVYPVGRFTTPSDHAMNFCNRWHGPSTRFPQILSPHCDFRERCSPRNGYSWER
ncbi:hypothetical protein C8R45DRAFT_291316 [Mycena sanguinolenta]|nr:hypothetical protein C8R45DRAFT_291316 [Mycena sanguinolenta]